MIRALQLILLTLAAACSTSSDGVYSSHDFAVARIATEGARQTVARSEPVPVDNRRINLARRAAMKKFSHSEETKGLLNEPSEEFRSKFDSGTLSPEHALTLDELLWVGYRTSPMIDAARKNLIAAFEGYNQVRFLDDIVSRYRSFTTTTAPPSTGAMAAAGSRKAPTMKAPYPALDTLRGDLADLATTAAWEQLTEIIATQTQKLTRMAADLAYTVALGQAMDEHLVLVKRLVAVVQTQLTSGRARQADLLVIQSELNALQIQRANLVHKKRAQSMALNIELDRDAKAPLTLAPLPTPAGGNDTERMLTSVKEHDAITRRLRVQTKRAATALRLAERMTLASIDTSAADVRIGQLGSAGTARSKMLIQPTGNVPGRSRGNGPTQALLNAMRQKLQAKREATEARVVEASRMLSLAQNSQQSTIDLLKVQHDEIIPLTQSAAKSIEQSYASRKASFLDMHRAATRLIRATTDAARFQRDIILFTAEIRALLARSSGEMK